MNYLPEIDFTQGDEVLRKLGANSGQQERRKLLNRRFLNQPQQGDEHLVRLQNQLTNEARTFEQAATVLWREDSTEPAIVAHGKSVWLSAFAIALRPEGLGVLDHSPRRGATAVPNSVRGNNPFVRFFIKDWWRSVLLVSLIGVLVILAGDGGVTPILLAGGLWALIEMIVGFRRLRSKRNSTQQTLGNGRVTTSGGERQAEIIGQWRPGFRFVFFAVIYLVLVVLTSGILLIVTLVFLAYPLWATAQITKGSMVDVEGELVQVKYWIRRSRVWLVTHKLTPRALVKQGRLTQMFIGENGKLYLYQREFTPFLILRPDPDNHDLKQFSGGSNNVSIANLSGVLNRLLGLCAPYGDVEVVGPNKDKPLKLEGIVDPKRVGDVLTTFTVAQRQEEAGSPSGIDQNMIAGVVAAVTAAMSATRAGGPENNQ